MSICIRLGADRVPTLPRLAGNTIWTETSVGAMSATTAAASQASWLVKVTRAIREVGSPSSTSKAMPPCKATRQAAAEPHEGGEAVLLFQLIRHDDTMLAICMPSFMHASFIHLPCVELTGVDFLG